MTHNTDSVYTDNMLMGIFSSISVSKEKKKVDFDINYNPFPT